MRFLLLISLLFAVAPPADVVPPGCHHEPAFVPDQPIAANRSVELVYQVSIGSKVIGRFQVSRIHRSDSVFYQASSEINTHIGFRLTQDYRLNTTFSEGHLVSSVVRHVVNDKVRADTRILYQDETYQITTDRVERLKLSPITFSVPRLFFTEPVSRRAIFSETYGEYLDCQPIENGEASEYILRTPDGKRTHYYYNGSVCERWEVKLLIFDVKYVLLEARMLA